MKTKIVTMVLAALFLSVAALGDDDKERSSRRGEYRHDRGKLSKKDRDRGRFDRDKWRKLRAKRIEEMRKRRYERRDKSPRMRMSPEQIRNLQRRLNTLERQVRQLRETARRQGRPYARKDFDTRPQDRRRFTRRPQVPTQRGMGDKQGIVRSGADVKRLTLKGKVKKVIIEPCKNTTGRYSQGSHFLLKTRDGVRNVHMGPAAEVKKLAKRLEQGKSVKVKAFRTRKMPEGHCVAITVNDGDKTMRIRGDDLRPKWAGQQADRKRRDGDRVRKDRYRDKRGDRRLWRNDRDRSRDIRRNRPREDRRKLNCPSPRLGFGQDGRRQQFQPRQWGPPQGRGRQYFTTPYGRQSSRGLRPRGQMHSRRGEGRKFQPQQQSYRGRFDGPQMQFRGMRGGFRPPCGMNVSPRPRRRGNYDYCPMTPRRDRYQPRRPRRR